MCQGKLFLPYSEYEYDMSMSAFRLQHYENCVADMKCQVLKYTQRSGKDLYSIIQLSKEAMLI